MVGPKAGVPSLRGVGSVVSFPSEVRGRENHILAYFELEDHRKLMQKIRSSSSIFVY